MLKPKPSSHFGYFFFPQSLSKFCQVWLQKLPQTSPFFHWALNYSLNYLNYFLTILPSPLPWISYKAFWFIPVSDNAFSIEKPEWSFLEYKPKIIYLLEFTQRTLFSLTMKTNPFTKAGRPQVILPLLVSLISSQVCFFFSSLCCKQSGLGLFRDFWKLFQPQDIYNCFPTA